MEELSKNILIALGVWIVVALPTILILIKYHQKNMGFNGDKKNETT